ncbi:MAG: hypothetical protein R2932_04955 [Caldilineaceae bacterium]
MVILNRIVAAWVWLFLLACITIVAVAPFWAVRVVQNAIISFAELLARWHAANSTNFIIGQATIGISAVLIFGFLFWLTAIWGYNRGVKIRTVDGGSAELDINSISRRLEWQLEQVAEVSNVVPTIKARGGSVDIRLEVEVAPEVDIPMKTDEVVIMTRDVIEDAIGLKLGKLDVHLRCAPFKPSLV